jgi:hypothetical protein
LFAIASLAAYGSYGCSSSSSGPGVTGADGGSPDGQVTGDGGTGDGGGTGIGGSTDISVTVVQYATPMNTPLANASVRAEVAGVGFIDAKTDAMGVAHMKVDLAKAPNGIDVTVANAGFNAVSILGVKAAVPGNVVLSAIGAMPTFTEFAATGTIANAGATHKLQIDAWDWQTVVTAPAATMFSTKFEVSAGLMVPMPVSAIEVDTANTANGLSAGTAVKGVLAGSTTMPRPMGPTMVAIDMNAAGAQMPNNSTVTMNWPTTGLFTKSAIKGAGAPVQDMHIGSGIVEKLTTAEAQAAMFVGIANVDPMDNSKLHLQTFGGAMSPDIAGTEVTTIMPGGTATATDYAAIVYAHDLMGSPTLNIGALNKLSITGMALTDATFEVDADGYDTTEFFVSSKQGMTSTTIWVIYSLGGKLAPRKLPSLPGGVMLGDLGGDVTSADMAAQVVKYVNNAAQPWQSIVQDQGYLIGNALGTALDPTFTR